MLDHIHFDSFLWSVLHEPKLFQISEERIIRVTYPVLPWIGIMALGYCFGSLYKKEFSPAERQKWLLILGTTAIFLFPLLRFMNMYGDPQPLSQQSSTVFTLLSFLNTTKYPPSLLFTLMTLGPALFALSLLERISNWMAKPVISIGRVPFFYYILHIYLIHLAAMFAAEISGFVWSDMILQKRTWLDAQLKGYGFSLGVTYLVWIGIVLLLYPLCKWYDRYKTANKQKWWLSYL